METLIDNRGKAPRMSRAKPGVEAEQTWLRPYATEFTRDEPPSVREGKLITRAQLHPSAQSVRNPARIGGHYKPKATQKLACRGDGAGLIFLPAGTTRQQWVALP